MMLLELQTALGLIAGAILIASEACRKRRMIRRCNDALRRTFCMEVAK